jgi:hypothetical protein
VDRGRVARSTVDRQWRGPKALEHGGALTGAWPPATPGHGSSPAGAQQREGYTGNSARASLGLGQWRGGQATEGNGGGGRCLVGWELRTRERAKEGGGECGDGRGKRPTVMAITPLKAGWLDEGIKGGLKGGIKAGE